MTKNQALMFDQSELRIMRPEDDTDIRTIRGYIMSMQCNHKLKTTWSARICVLTLCVIAASLIAASFVFVGSASSGASQELAESSDAHALAEYDPISSPERAKAEYLLHDDYFMQISYGQINAPYHDLLAEMVNDENFMSEVKLWKRVNYVENLDELGEDVVMNNVFDAKGYYETILYDVVVNAEDDESLAKEIESALKASNASLYKEAATVLGEEFDPDMLKSKKLTNEQVDRLSADFDCLDAFKNYMGLAGTIKDTYGYINDLTDLVNKYSAVEAMGEHRDTIVLLLDRMYVSTDDTQLQEAIADLSARFQSTYDNNLMVLTDVTTEAIKDLISETINKGIWTDLCASSTIGWAKLAADFGKCLSNTWCSTDKRIENFQDMYCLQGIELALESALRVSRENYTTMGTEEAAAVFNEAVDLTSRCYSMGYKLCSDRFKIIDETLYNEVFGHVDLDSLVAHLKAEADSIDAHRDAMGAIFKEIAAQDALHFIEDGSLYQTAYESYKFDLTSSDDTHAFSDVYASIKEVYPDYVSKLSVAINALTVDAGDTVYLPNSFNTPSISSLTMNGGELDCDGGVTIGNTSLSNSVVIRGGLLNVNGDMTLCPGSGSGIDGDTVYVRVLGDMSVPTGKVDGWISVSNVYPMKISAGTVEVKGDFLTSCFWEMSGTSKLVFSGEEEQKVTDTTLYAGQMSLGGGQIRAVFSNPDVAWDTTATLVLVQDSQLTPSETVKLGTLDLNGHSLTSSADIVMKNGALKVGNATAAEVTAPSVKAYSASIGETQALSVHGDVSLTKFTMTGGALTCDGDLLVDGGSSGTQPHISGGTIDVSGGVWLGWVLVDSDDALIKVGGNLSGGSYQHYMTMKAGTVEVKGNVTLNKWMHFSGTSRLVMCGEGHQSMSSDYTSEATVRLEVLNPDVSVDCAYDTFTLLNDAELSSDAAYKFYTLNMNGHQAQFAGPLTVSSYLYPGTGSGSGLAGEVTAPSATIGRVLLEGNDSLTFNGDTQIKSLVMSGGHLTCNGLLTVGNYNTSKYVLSSISGGEVDANGDLAFNVSKYGDTIDSNDAVIKVAGNLSTRGSDGRLYFKSGTIEVQDDVTVATCLTMTGSSHIVMCGTSSQSVTGTNGAINLVNTHAQEDDVDVADTVQEQVYVWDPAYTTSCRYIQLATALGVTYAGESNLPSLSYGSDPMASGVDYEIVATENTDVAGMATVSVTGMGAYKGSADLSYDIAAADISGAMVTLDDVYAYTGEAIEPDPLVTLNGAPLERDTDYTVSYDNNVEPGSARMVIQGKGNYAGTVSSAFKIVRKYAVDVLCNYDNAATLTGGGQYAEGSMVTVAVAPDEEWAFMYWVDATTHRVLSRETELALSVAGDVSVEAMLAPLAPAGDAHVVTFVDMDGMVLSVQLVDDGSGVKVPEHGQFAGYSFTGWSVDEGELDKVSSDLTVEALYERVQVMEAPELSDDESAAKVALSIGERQAGEGTTQLVPCVAAWAVPGGATVLQAGIVRVLRDGSLDVPSSDALSLGHVGEALDGSTIKSCQSALVAATGTFEYTLTLRASVQSRLVYAVAYVVYREDDTGEISTVYSEMVCG